MATSLLSLPTSTSHCFLREVTICIFFGQVINKVESQLFPAKRFCVTHPNSQPMPLTGCSATCQNEYHHRFPAFLQHYDLIITALESLTIVVAIKLWASKHLGTDVDNMNCVQMSNNRRSRNRFMHGLVAPFIFVLYSPISSGHFNKKHTKTATHLCPSSFCRLTAN